MSRHQQKQSQSIRKLKEKSRQAGPAHGRDDSFEAVAKRLECDTDMDKFLKKLGKIAWAKPKPQDDRGST